MSRMKRFMDEAAYYGNLGFMEMIEFIDKASPLEVKKMEEYVEKEDWEAYKKLIKKVIGVTLK